MMNDDDSYDKAQIGIINILQYFSYIKKDGFHIYRLEESETERFLNSITNEFRQCYILDSELTIKSNKNGIDKTEFLEQYILPNVGNIKSGDFGEMLSCFFIKEHYGQNKYMLICPRKWLWKEDRNKATPLTDAVGFYRKDKMNTSEEDFVVSIESKMNATGSKEYRIQEAIDGANKDKTSRLAKTLVWLKEKYARNGDIEMRKYIERFSDPVAEGTYNKIFKAFAILDKIFEDSEISAKIENNEGLIVIIIIMDNLKGIYENNLKKIMETA